MSKLLDVSPDGAERMVREAIAMLDATIAEEMQKADAYRDRAMSYACRTEVQERQRRFDIGMRYQQASDALSFVYREREYLYGQLAALRMYSRVEMRLEPNPPQA